MPDAPDDPTRHNTYSARGMTMHLLPTTLAKLADIAGGNGRYAMNGIHLVLNGDNTFIAEATDTKFVVRVSGACREPDDYPINPAFELAPNGELEALIPAKFWKATFAAADKLTKRYPKLRAVAAKIGKEEATFGYTNMDSSPCDRTRLIEGQFPPIANILPVSSTATDTVCVDAKKLAELLTVVASMIPDGDATNNAVTLETRGNGLMTVHVGRPDALRIIGGIMPLPSEGSNREEPEAATETAPTATASTEHVDALLAELETIRGLLTDAARRESDLIAANERTRQEWRDSAEREAERRNALREAMDAEFAAIKRERDEAANRAERAVKEAIEARHAARWCNGCSVLTNENEAIVAQRDALASALTGYHAAALAGVPSWAMARTNGLAAVAALALLEGTAVGALVGAELEMVCEG